MSCSECAQYRLRANRAERLVLLFTQTFAQLSQALGAIEAEGDSDGCADDSPDENIAPTPGRQFLVLPVKLVVGEAQPDAGEAIE